MTEEYKTVLTVCITIVVCIALMSNCQWVPK